MDEHARGVLETLWRRNEAELEQLRGLPAGGMAPAMRERDLETQQAEIERELGEDWIERSRAGDCTPPQGERWVFSNAFFVDLLHQAAPERRSEVNRLICEHGVRFIAVEGWHHPKFCVDLGTRAVYISTSSLLRLWAHTWAYLVLYREISEHAGRPASTLGDESRRAVNQAERLFGWAVQQDIEAVRAMKQNRLFEPVPLPEGVPVPFDPSSEDPVATLATHLSQMALGFVLLHEVGHVVLGHKRTSWLTSIEQENEADTWASHMLLDRLAEYASSRHPDNSDAAALVRSKRLQAFAVGFFWLILHETVFGRPNQPDHPPAFERLFRGLSRFEPDPNALVWAIAYVVLSLHLYGAGARRAPAHATGTFKEQVNQLCDTLSHGLHNHSGGTS